MDSLSSFLNVKEVSEYLALKISTIYSMVEDKRIPHYKVGRLVRFKKFEIDEWMAGQKKEVVDVKAEARKVIKSIEKKADLDVDGIIKKAIDEAGKKGYNFPQEKPGRIKGLGKEVQDGII